MDREEEVNIKSVDNTLRIYYQVMQTSSKRLRFENITKSEKLCMPANLPQQVNIVC